MKLYCLLWLGGHIILAIYLNEQTSVESFIKKTSVEPVNEQITQYFKTQITQHVKTHLFKQFSFRPINISVLNEQMSLFV